MRQLVEEEHCVDEDIAFRMKLRRLRHALHRGDFGQDLMQQTACVEEQESTARLTCREHLRELIPYTLAGDLVNLRCQLLNRGKRSGLNGIAEASGEAHRAQHAQLVFGEAALG